MKKGDFFAVLYAAVCVGVVICFPFGVKNDTLTWGMDVNGNGVLNFGAVTKAYPFIMGFLKVALLATFGEMIKMRGKTGSYHLDRLGIRFFVWGLYGILFTVAFPVFAIGVQGLVKGGLWFGSVDPAAALPFKILMAFSSSLFINLIFAYPMMLSHEWFNMVIARRKFVGGAEFMGAIDKNLWGSFIPKTIIWFWIPAHTITFSLPPEYRILMAAGLSVALGFLLTFKPKK